MHIAEGRIRLLGRADEMLSRGGRNVFPIEIENVLAEHGSVTAAAVVGVHDESGFDRLVAFVEIVPAADPPEDLVQWCADRLSPHKVPNVVRVVDALPRTRNGKVRKVALRVEAQQLVGAPAEQTGASGSNEGGRR